MNVHIYPTVPVVDSWGSQVRHLHGHRLPSGKMRAVTFVCWDTCKTLPVQGELTDDTYVIFDDSTAEYEERKTKRFANETFRPCFK